MNKAIPLITYACIFLLMAYDVYSTLKYEYKDYSRKEKTSAKIAIFIMICTLAFPWWVVTRDESKPIKKVPYVPSYTKPEIADSTKHDWVKDENVCIERRIVYDQMLNEKLAR